MKNKSANARLTTLRICVFNLAGGRTKHKWKTVVKNAFDSNDEGLILLSETELMNEETAPSIKGYRFFGSNRTGQSGKHAKAGVGILFPTKFGVETWVENGKGYVAIGFSLLKQE